MKSRKENRDYITHIPMDLGSLPSNYIINRGKEILIDKYSKDYRSKFKEE
jgi:hypothetical protein